MWKGDGVWVKSLLIFHIHINIKVKNHIHKGFKYLPLGSINIHKVNKLQSTSVDWMYEKGIAKPKTYVLASFKYSTTWNQFDCVLQGERTIQNIPA